MDLVELATNGFDAYRSFNESHPWLGAMATAEVTFIAGDSTSQLIKDRKVDLRKIRYTAAIAPVYGLGLNVLMESGNLVGRYISDNPIAKAALGPNLWGNVMNAFFFANNTIGERRGYSIPTLVKNYSEVLTDSSRTIGRRIKENIIDNIPGKEFTMATIGTLTFWNAFQGYNYAYIEESMRTPATLAVAFGWIALMSLWSLTGRRRKVRQLEQINRE